MKLIAERTHLLAALKAVCHLADSKAKIPMLATVRLRTDDSRLFLAATDNDAYAEAEIAAEVERQGAVCIAGDVLLRMTGNFPEGAQVSIDAGDALATVKAGRSRYQPHVLPAADFPSIFVATGKVARFMLMPEEVRRLFDITRPAAAKGMKDRPYLEGVYLHTSEDDATMWGVAGSGYVLLAANIEAPEGAQDLPKLVEPDGHHPGRPRGLMVPLDSVAHLLRLGEVPLEIEAGENVLAVRGAGGGVKVSYATRLLENRYPPYERAVPPLEGPRITVEAGAFSAAVKRLADMSGNDERPVAIEWGEEGDLSLWLDDHADGIYGTETLEIESRTGAGRVGIRSGFIMKAIEAVGRGHVEIWCAGEDKPVRFRNLDDADLVAVAAPQTLRRRPHQGAAIATGEAA